MAHSKIINFASDNYVGLHPEVLQSLTHALSATDYPYGDDAYTRECQNLFKNVFGNEVETFFVGNGTAANTCALKHVLKSTECVFSTDIAHINTDECGAFELMTGAKIVSSPHENGKINISKAYDVIKNQHPIHRNKFKVLSVSQTTEIGTVYSIDELKEIRNLCDEFNLILHMDGARIYNAMAHLNVSFKHFFEQTKVDILSLGGTKNGLFCAEAVLFFNQNLAQDFLYTQKQLMQLYSKLRFIPAQFMTLFKNDLWLKNALNANAAALSLASKISEIQGLRIAYPVQSNMVFIEMPNQVYDRISQNVHCYKMMSNPKTQSCTVRFVTNYATVEQDIENLLKTLVSKVL